ncbi:MAG: type II secretion system protein [Candidatus Gottesmanbacteria bacterium]|nr:type II secretion system protein [Candidatus Gottesmanbacteria bacterium]
MKNKRGFTLIELLIVIAIIGILVSVSVASYSSAQKKGRDARRLADMKAVQNAFEQYYADNNGSYPATCNLITATATYLPAGFPTDPRNNTTETVLTKKFVYSFTDTHCSATSYCFCAHLESGTGNASADPGSDTCAYTSGSYYCVGNLQ